jgi:hypothetical protein
LDLAIATKQPVPVTLAGREYLIRPRTLDELGELQAWYKRAVASPLTRALSAIESSKGHGFTLRAETRDAMLSVALAADASWPPRVGSLAWARAVEDSGEFPHVIRWALLPCQPTKAEAAALYESTGPGDLLAILYAAVLGKAPDPKDRGATATPPTTTTTTTTDPSPPPPTTGAP